MMRTRWCRSSQQGLWTGVVLACVVAVAAAAPAAAQPFAGSPLDGGLPGKRAQSSGLAAAAPAATASASLTPCAEDPAFLCTTVPVPLDRRHPDGRMVNLHVEVFPHTGPQAEGAVFATCGGPGCAISGGLKYGFVDVVLPEVAQTRDLVFVDQRGVGLSDVIDCPAAQAFGPLYESWAACHDQLGDAANLYSTTDVADDLEDVRRALGYGRIDLVGGSYAGADMLTYAVRHAGNVRSAVLTSPAVFVGSDPFYAYAPEAMTGIAAKVCGRSPACRAANPDPARAFVRLVRDLRRHPVSGIGVDTTGASHQVTVTENLLVNAIMYYNGAHFIGPGEIIQAMNASRRGDDVPLLRLGADTDPATPLVEEPRFFSMGHNIARFCVDGELPFDKTAAAPTRFAQFARAYAREPDFYGPFSKEAWAHPGYLGFQPSPCIASRWEDRPMYPEGTRIKGVPTLVLGGEYDVPVPEAVSRRALGVMKGATYAGIRAAGHTPEFWGPCGPELVQRFIATGSAGDTSCADRAAGGWWVPGVFAKRVREAPPASHVDGRRASKRLRRLVTVAAWTVMDSVQHNFGVPDDSVALRGGTVDWEPTEDGATWTLGAARFTEDVAVSGPLTGVGPDFSGDFTVEGPGDRTTTMRIAGPFLTDGADMTISFEIGGRTATFTVPAY
jgi:pimeloyl-ACP methyl ester carboxylesterase